MIGRTQVGIGSCLVSTDRLPIKMLHDRVLVKVSAEEGERRSSGGILIPATAQVSKRLIWGEALAVGNHVRSVELNDRVLFSPDDRHEVEISGEDYLLLRERDIHAVAAQRIESNTGLSL
jgi:chaperonin GroES